MAVGPIWILNVPQNSHAEVLVSSWRRVEILEWDLVGGSYVIRVYQDPKSFLVALLPSCHVNEQLSSSWLLPQLQSNRVKYSTTDMAETVSQNKCFFFWSCSSWAFCHADGAIHRENMVGRENSMGEGAHTLLLPQWGLRRTTSEAKVGWAISCFTRL